MFCPYCGQSLTDDASFCIFCGNMLPSVGKTLPAVRPVDGTRISSGDSVPSGSYLGRDHEYRESRKAVREGELQSLTEVYDYFVRKSDRFEAYDRACAQVEHYSRGASSAMLIWGCIVSSLAAMMMIYSASEGSFEDDFLSFLFLLLIPGLLMIAGGILLKVNCARKLARFRQEQTALAQELSDYYLAYPDCPVGPEFTNPDTLMALLNTIRSGRADTIKEALNLMVGGTR